MDGVQGFKPALDQGAARRLNAIYFVAGLTIIFLSGW
jgi:hypothetical protein